MIAYKLPEPYRDGITTTVEINFGLRDRIKLLFGQIATVHIETLCEFPPGKVETKTCITIKPLHGGFPVQGAGEVFVTEEA